MTRNGEAMSDDTTNTDTATTAETADAATETATATEPDWKAEAEKWKAFSRKNEETAKANSGAAKRLAELEEANKSEIEKAQARAEAAEKELNTSRLDALRAQVALDKKLTPSQAKRLVGSTREELEADADELLLDLKDAAPAAAASSEGQGKQGEAVGGVKQITSESELDSMTSEQIVAARAQGRLDGLLGVKTK
jgi:hypothetical protein